MASSLHQFLTISDLTLNTFFAEISIEENLQQFLIVLSVSLRDKFLILL